MCVGQFLSIKMHSDEAFGQHTTCIAIYWAWNVAISSKRIELITAGSLLIAEAKTTAPPVIWTNTVLRLEGDENFERKPFSACYILSCTDVQKTCDRQLNKFF